MRREKRHMQEDIELSTVSRRVGQASAYMCADVREHHNMLCNESGACAALLIAFCYVLSILISMTYLSLYGGLAQAEGKTKHKYFGSGILSPELLHPPL